MLKKFLPKNLIISNSIKNFNKIVEAQPPQKSKEELKIEKLMEQWPEFIRNPDSNMIDAKELKHKLEYIYKFHQGDKPYMKYWDLPDKTIEEIGPELLGIFTTDNIIEKFKEYEGYITIELLFEKFQFICTNHQELTPEFYDYLIPLIKKHIAKADRHCNDALAKACISGALINLGDREYWDLLVKLFNIRNSNLLEKSYTGLLS
jgi:hemerythrin